MTDLDVMERVGAIWGTSVFPLKKRQPHWKQAYYTKVKGSSARYWMERLYPLMGQRRQRQITDALESCPPAAGKRRLTPGEIADIASMLRLGIRAQVVAECYGIARENVYLYGRKQGVSGRRSSMLSVEDSWTLARQVMLGGQVEPDQP